MIKPIEESMMDFLSDLTTDIDLLGGDAKGVLYWYKDYVSKDRQNIKDSLVEGLEGMKMEYTKFVSSEHPTNEDVDAHNQALQDAIDYITKELT